MAEAVRKSDNRQSKFIDKSNHKGRMRDEGAGRRSKRDYALRSRRAVRAMKEATRFEESESIETLKVLVEQFDSRVHRPSEELSTGAQLI